MSKRPAAVSLALAALLLSTGARAQSGDGMVEDAYPKLVNASPYHRIQRPAGDTTWVGYNPAYAGPSNYWSVGVGSNRPPAGGDNSRRGYWDWDTPIHGDSLQGWWPVRHPYAITGGLTLADDIRPWWAIDMGNQVNYVINQGAANKRTFGVTGVWHSDPGNTVGATIPGTNPTAPSWAPLAGSRSAWCGLRAHGDLTAMDPITGNAFNVAALENTQLQGVGNGSGTSRKFPGYASQWDQMLYRDVDLTGAGATLTLKFKLRTRMSTLRGTNAATRTGWFDKDPKAVVLGNYIKSTGNATPPVDSFMVYVGNPVEPDGDNTNSNDFVASDGLSYDIYDPLRRWFSEVIRTEGGSAPNTHHELFSGAGDRDTDVTLTIPTASLASYGGRVRLVFRIKTNRGFDDEGGSNPGAYSSAGMGAAQIDDVIVNLGAGDVLIGDFEDPASIDNALVVPALAKWKSTGKPPAIFHHVHNLSTLTYQDMCGAPGAPTRVCNMMGGVISMGDHDQFEASAGFGTAEQERADGMFSPTIDLATAGPGSPDTPNPQGLTWNIVDAADDYCISYEIYTGIFESFTQGSMWQHFAQSYPATQSDGVRCWGEPRAPAAMSFNPEKQCFPDIEGLLSAGLIRTSNPGSKPDSIRLGLRKLQQCFRFGISANCAPGLGAYWDNVSLALVNGPAPAFSVEIWHWLQDTFPANELSTLPGTAAFDTCAALVKTGLNIAQATGNTNVYDIPGDSTVITAGGDNVRVDLVFRINPGPGSYVTAGYLTSGLRVVPKSPTAITAGDNSFWTSYILNNGAKGTPSGHPAGAHATRWSSLVWNSARCDTAELSVFPVQARNLSYPQDAGLFQSTLHESELSGPRATLAVSRNYCFLNDVAGTAPITAIHCNTAKDLARFGAYPPAWVVSTQSTNGWNGSLTTAEGTKILPDGLFTPGTHVQYFFVRTNLSTGLTSMVPDTNHVFPQDGEGPSYDGHRWQSWSVLPDAWKKTAYGGLGQACSLVLDWDDRRGDEMTWVSILDSLCNTSSSKYGAHNGWHQAGSVSVNDPSGFVRNLNQQPGTTWDLYSVKAAESITTPAGTFGARLAYRATGATNLIDGQWARNAPTLNMLEAYYRIVVVMTGDLNSSILGPFNNKSADDEGIFQSYLLGATAGSNRAMWFIGDGLVESLDPDPWLDNFGVSLAAPGYRALSGNLNPCADLTPQASITTNGDVYGVVNGCTFTNDVFLTSGPDALPSLLYPNFGNPLNWPYIAGVYKAANAPNYWKSVVDGFDIQSLRSRFCDGDLGRLAYYYNGFKNIFGSICAVQGSPLCITDVPDTDPELRDFMALRNNPLRSGFAQVVFGLAAMDRVEIKIFDVSGRSVRTLADRTFIPGEHTLLWDGTNDHGDRLPRGVYFTRISFASRGFEQTKKTIVLK